MSSTPLASNSGFMAKYMALEQPRDKILVAYVYLCPGNDGLAHLSSKSKVVNFVPESASQLPLWDMAMPVGTKLVERFIRPVQLYADPFRGGNNKLVLCELLTADMKPLSNNYRYSCNEAMELARDQHPWFGVEQEYYLMDSKTNWPLGWPKNGYPEPLTAPHAFYYGAVGANNQYGRDVMEAHLRACLYAGVNICGENAEAQPAQWEYQVYLINQVNLQCKS
jgi:glutamine synthetase